MSSLASVINGTNIFRVFRRDLLKLFLSVRCKCCNVCASETGIVWFCWNSSSFIEIWVERCYRGLYVYYLKRNLWKWAIKFPKTLTLTVVFGLPASKNNWNPYNRAGRSAHRSPSRTALSCFCTLICSPHFLQLLEFPWVKFKQTDFSENDLLESFF